MTSAMKLRLRVALVFLLVGIVVPTVATIGFVSSINSRAAAQELAGQVLEQTSLGIDHQIDALLGDAIAATSVVSRVIESGQIKSDDFPQITVFFRNLMDANPQLTSLFIVLRTHGESVGVSRLTGNKLSVWQTTWNPAVNGLDLREFPAGEDPSHILVSGKSGGGPDSRPRPYYVAAKNTGDLIWTNAYVFLGIGKVRNMLGVTQATPVFDRDHTFDAAVTADFDIGQLSRFLQGLHVGRHGYAFIVELHDDGSRQVIAHPHPEILFAPASSGGSGAGGLSTIKDLADARTRALLAQVPASVGKNPDGDSGSIRFSVDGMDYIGNYRTLQGRHRPHWLICTLLPEEDVLAYAHRSARMTICIAVAAMALALALSILVSRQVARPLEYLARDVGAVGRLKLDARSVGRSIVREVDDLATAAEEMKAGLRSFQKYVPVDLVRGLLESGQEANLGGQRRTLSILFTDIVDFTATAERMPGEALVAHLGDYLGLVSDQIEAQHGTVDKFIGDSVMAFWGAPAMDPLHATAACVTAWRTQQKLAALRPMWQAAAKPPYHTRIGVHTGEVVVGNIGSTARMNYTVVGDAVNVASRLEALNRYYGSNILVSDESYNAAKGRVVARPIDWVLVHGRAQPILVYELLGVRGEVDSATLEFVECATNALTCYREGNWRQSIQLFQAATKIRAGDAPSAIMMARCEEYLKNPPGDGWDGLHRMTGK